MTAATPAGPNAYHWIVTVKYGDDTLSNLNGVLTISPAATIADAVQVISEFGQNAIRHVNTSGTDFDVMTVTAAVWDGHLKVTLSDPGVFADVPAELGGDLDEHGWGIGVIVAALSTCYGFEAVAGGKVAWATLEFGGAA